MKKLFLISLLFYASMLNAQVSKIHGFAGDNKKVYTGFGEYTTQLGYAGDFESLFLWEYIDGPDGASDPTITNERNPVCKVSFPPMNPELGVYTFQVTRMSDYGIQVELVEVTVTNKFEIISIEPKTKCFSEDTYLNVTSFNIITDPPISKEDVYFFIKLATDDGPSSSYHLETKALASKETISFMQMGKTIEGHKPDEYDFYRVEATADVYTASQKGNLNINALDGKALRQFFKNDKLKGIIGVFKDKENWKLITNIIDAVDAPKKLNDKTQPFLNKIPLKRKLRADFRVSGGLGINLGILCYEDNPAVKVAFSPNIGYCFSFEGSIPTTLQVPGVSVDFVFGFSVDAKLTGNMEIYFPLYTGKKFNNTFVPSVQGILALTGKLGGAVNIIDPQICRGEVAFYPQINVTVSCSADDGVTLKNSGFHLDCKVTLHLGGISFIEYPYNFF